MNAILETRKLCKSYRRGTSELQVLKEVDLQVNQGELTFIVGSSGSGKSTLLQLSGGLDSATSGEVIIGGTNIQRMSDCELSAFRRKKLGFVFQFFNLLSNLTVLENAAIPLLLDKVPWKFAKEKAKKLLVDLGLENRMNHYPFELSGGQMQRVAIARALVAGPDLILADEPTGNLDSKTANEIMNLFRELVEIRGQSIVMVTHDRKILEYGHRVIEIKDGKIENDKRVVT